MSNKQYNSLVPRITGLLILEVRKSNPNGDPERESSPRQRPDGKGEISPVSVKRKLRDLVLEKEGVVWSETKESLSLTDDNFQILESRGRNRDEIKKKMEPKDGKIGQGFIDAYSALLWLGSTPRSVLPRGRRPLGHGAALSE